MWEGRDVRLPSEEVIVNDCADDLIADLVLALDDEKEARCSLRTAQGRQAELLRALRSAGLRFQVIVHRVARARGIVLPLDEKLRFAERLRKRASRGCGVGS